MSPPIIRFKVSRTQVIWIASFSAAATAVITCRCTHQPKRHTVMSQPFSIDVKLSPHLAYHADKHICDRDGRQDLGAGDMERWGQRYSDKIGLIPSKIFRKAMQTPLLPASNSGTEMHRIHSIRTLQILYTCVYLNIVTTISINFDRTNDPK